MSGRLSRWFLPVVPPPVFGRRSVPADRLSRGEAAPVVWPDPSPLTAAVLGAPRWVGCPDDGRLHLLRPTGVLEATVLGFTSAPCGVLIFAEGLVLTGPSGEPCVECLAAGTVS